MADFDTISKHLIQTYPEDFARFTLEQDHVEVIEVIDTEQFTVEARRADSLLRVRLDDEVVLIHTAYARALSRSAKADFLAGMSLLSGLVYASATISELLSKEGLMDLIRESSFAQYLTEQAREEGIEEGIEQGLRESILDVLEIRFDLHAGHPLSARIVAIDNVQRLKQLHRWAIQVPSLEAFQHMLDQEQN